MIFLIEISGMDGLFTLLYIANFCCFSSIFIYLLKGHLRQQLTNYLRDNTIPACHLINILTTPERQEPLSYGKIIE